MSDADWQVGKRIQVQSSEPCQLAFEVNSRLMKRHFLRFAAVFLMATACGIAAPDAGKETIKLLSGDTMTGTVGTVRDGTVSLITEYGPVRIPLDKISAESKAKLGIGAEADADALRKRIAELEDLVARIREENATLRRNGTSAGGTTTPAPVQPLTGGGRATPSPVPTPAPAPVAQAGAFRLSSTGKRHNSRCRYYSSAGRPCTATEGVACKICGG